MLLMVDGAVPLLVLMRPVFMWCCGRIDWEEAANAVERANPSFGQRLQTVVSQLLEKQQYRGSQEIVDHLVQEVSGEASAQRPRSVVPWRPAMMPVLGAVGALAGVAALMSVPTLGMPSLVRRLVHPLRVLPPVTTTQLAVDPQNKSILLGQPLVIRVQASRLPDDSVDLYTSADGRSWAQNSMLPSVLGDYVFTLPAVDRDLRYYVTGGDATSPTYLVSVLRPPAVVEFHVRCDYPAYLDLPPLKRVSSEANVEAPVGSTLTLGVVSTEALKSAMLTSGAQKIAMAQAGDASVWQATMMMQKDQTLNLEMQGIGGQGQRGPVSVVVRALPDKAPSVKLVRPVEDVRLHSTDSLSVQYAAHDDHALASLNALVQVNGQKCARRRCGFMGTRGGRRGSFRLIWGRWGCRRGTSSACTCRRRTRQIRSARRCRARGGGYW